MSRKNAMSGKKAMSRELRWYLGIFALLLLLGGLGYWGYQQIRWKVETIDLGYSEQAREDPYLASAQFLERLGVHVERRKGFSLLEQLGEPGSEIAQGDTLILVNSYRMLHGQQFEQLWRWVEQGGQLIVAANNPYLAEQQISNDLLFERLGVSINDDRPDYELAIEVSDDQQQLLEQDNPEHCDIDSHLTVIERAEGEPLYLQLGGESALEIDSPLLGDSLSNRHGLQVAQFALQQGQITLFTRLSLWQNGALDCLDHGYLLQQLSSADSTSWILLSQDRPSLAALLWRYLPLAVTLLGALLLLWLWQAGHRFGPQLAAEPSPRRELIEHLQASAQLLWRHKRYRALLAPAQDEICRLMRQRIPGFDQLEHEQQLNEIAATTHIDIRSIRSAMTEPKRLTPRELIARVHHLQRIKESLCRR